LNEPLVDIVVLIPVYNDWDAAALLLADLGARLPDRFGRARVLLVDDGSVSPAPDLRRSAEFARFDRIDVLELRRNLGHQRALAVGLCHVEANIPCRTVVVMDGDGEDAPADVAKLLDRMSLEAEPRIVFAERAKRSESVVFRVFYALYRWLHLLLTGIAVRVGNFSVVPYPLLRRLVAVSELWNHYAAAIFKARLPFVTVPTQRAVRLAGRSRMNFIALVTHGLSAISVFGDRVGVRLLVAVCGLFALVLGGLIATVAVKFATTVAIPGWATTAAGLLIVVMTQLVMLVAVFVFVVLSGREGSTFLPLRDYHYFIAGSKNLFARATESETA
jgi:glycosyltransferase involved in cell wall biosynthesis